MERGLWIELIAGVIKAKGRPMTRREILIDMSESYKISDDVLGVSLNNAKRLKQIGYIKILDKRPGYYCNPEWLDENGKLKEEFQYDPLWDKK